MCRPLYYRRLVIRRGVKLDNLIQIGHNVEVGENTVMSLTSWYCRQPKVGQWCMFGVQVGIAGHIEIDDKYFFSC